MSPGSWLSNAARGVVVGLLSAVGSLTLSASGSEPPPLTEGTVAPWIRDHHQQTVTAIRAAERGTIDSKAEAATVYRAASGQYTFRTLSDKLVELGRLETEIEHPTLPPLTLTTLKSGQLGSLTQPWTTYQVVRILDPKTAVLRAETTVPDAARNGRQERSLLVVSPIVRSLRESQRLASVPGTFQVSAGKRSYVSTNGATTPLDVLEDFDLSRYVKDTLRGRSSRGK